MEAIEIRNQPEDLRSHLAVRCAKAALFLSRLKFPPNRPADSTNFTVHEGDGIEKKGGGSDEEIGEGEIEESKGEALQRDGVASADAAFAVSMDSLFDARPQIPLIIVTSQFGNNLIHYMYRHFPCIGIRL
ncbi:hypothetical protein Vadar_020194 [Vaccinium darrowii]|uniref:Uncharacterized protein n=1 Tax=Vaccinium darrowii TaxID=229202 RepID=A0ACB7ZKN1_9ERIC|nr:hypothetical protein Vadar_020194 [Vaccinium darrowii]